jgi:hypothetical protein
MRLKFKSTDWQKEVVSAVLPKKGGFESGEKREARFISLIAGR